MPDGCSYRLDHGDCLQVLPKLADDSAHLICADLPYGVTQNKWDSVIPFAPLWEQLLRIGKQNAAFVFTATQPFATALISSQPKLFRYDLVWHKDIPTGFLNANRMPMRQHELVVVFYTKLPTYNPQRAEGGRKGRNGRNLSNKSTNYGKFVPQVFVGTGLTYPCSILNVASDTQRYRGTQRTLHPTQKPVALLEWLIKTYSNPGDTVLDPVMGSGTTGVACMNTGRHFVGIENEAKYFEIADKRIGAAYKKTTCEGA